jgi:hypothetical protein
MCFKCCFTVLDLWKLLSCSGEFSLKQYISYSSSFNICWLSAFLITHLMTCLKHKY